MPCSHHPVLVVASSEPAPRVDKGNVKVFFGYYFRYDARGREPVPAGDRTPRRAAVPRGSRCRGFLLVHSARAPAGRRVALSDGAAALRPTRPDREIRL